jgi:hypothetical protein
MSEISQGPGWWIASDGKWYPPESHPDVRAVTPPVGSSLPYTVGASPSHETATQNPSTSKAPRRPHRFLTLAIIALGVLVVAAMAYIGLSRISHDIGALAAGSGTGTLTWQKSAGCVTTFSGTAAGLSLSGTATGVFPASPTASRTGCLPIAHSGEPVTLPASAVAAQWKGTLGGTSFDLKLTYDINQATTTSSGPITFAQVDGTYGSRPVRVTVTAPSRSSDTSDFQGTVGDLSVSGSVQSKSWSSDKATATFTVTK